MRRKMACDEDIVKCLVFWTNFVLALVGIALISIGIIYKINLEELLEALPEEYKDLPVIPVLLFPLGVLLIFLAVFGCYGCLTEKIKYVIWYIAILLLLFLIQLTIGINAFTKLGHRNIFKSRLEVTLSQVFKNYTISKNRSLVDLIQHRVRCCGFNGTEFWSHGLPRSCLQPDSKGVFSKSCDIGVFEYINYCQHILGICITVLSLSEIIASVVSLFFVHYLKNLSKEFIFVKDYSFENGVI